MPLHPRHYRRIYFRYYVGEYWDLGLSHAHRNWQVKAVHISLDLDCSAIIRPSEFSEEQLKLYELVAQRNTSQEPSIFPLDKSSLTRAHEIRLLFSFSSQCLSPLKFQSMERADLSECIDPITRCMRSVKDFSCLDSSYI